MAVERTLGTTSVGPRKLQRRVGLVALMFTSVGSIIGSGWLLGAVAILFLALLHARRSIEEQRAEAEAEEELLATA